MRYIMSLTKSISVLIIKTPLMWSFLLAGIFIPCFDELEGENENRHRLYVPLKIG